MKYTGIAISGKAGAGKTEVARAIDEWLLSQWTPSCIMRLADEIYREAYEQGMSRDPRKKDRPLLQRIGDERTAQDPSYYPKQLVQSALWARQRMYAGNPLETGPELPELIVLCDDLRKVIEAEYLRQKGFALVRLNVDTAIRHRRLMQRDGRIQNEDHWTETDLDNYSRWDVVLPNNDDYTPLHLAGIIVTVLGVNIAGPER